MSKSQEKLSFTSTEFQTMNNFFENNQGIDNNGPKEHPKACCCCASPDEMYPKAE